MTTTAFRRGLVGVAIGAASFLSACESTGGSGGLDARLVRAARSGDVRAVEDLLASGADVDAQDAAGSSALAWAASEDHPEVVKTLLARGAEVDHRADDGFTPLAYAGQLESPAIARMLLEAGAKPNGRDEKGLTPLHQAAVRGRKETAAALLDGGADPDVLDRSLELTPLMAATVNGHAEVVALLLARGANAELRGMGAEYGWTALFLAVNKKDEALATKLTRMFLEHEVDVNARSASGETPLAVARKHGAASVVRMLQAAGAKD